MNPEDKFGLAVFLIIIIVVATGLFLGFSIRSHEAARAKYVCLERADDETERCTVAAIRLGDHWELQEYK